MTIYLLPGGGWTDKEPPEFRETRVARERKLFEVIDCFYVDTTRTHLKHYDVTRAAFELLYDLARTSDEISSSPPDAKLAEVADHIAQCAQELFKRIAVLRRNAAPQQPEHRPAESKPPPEIRRGPGRPPKEL